MSSLNPRKKTSIWLCWPWKDPPEKAAQSMIYFKVFEPHIPSINTFFEKVMVMAEDARLRENRLGLLQRIAALTIGVADLSQLEGF